MKIFQVKEQASRMSHGLTFVFILFFLAIPAVAGMTLSLFFTIFVDKRIAEVQVGGIGLIFLVGTVTFFLIMVMVFFMRRYELNQGALWLVTGLNATSLSKHEDILEKQRYQNVTEEMSIAAGVPVPKLFVIPTEQINALVTGGNKGNLSLMVTQGALERLSRDELSALVAHEMGHIVSEDVYLNTSMIAALAGLMCFYEMGQELTFVNSRKGSFILGFAFIGLGLLGMWAGRVLQAAICRQREWAADAQSAQFTRQPRALATLLRKIRDEQKAGKYRWDNPRANEVAHMCFINKTNPTLWNSCFGLMNTHPPLEKRLAVARGVNVPPSVS